MARILCIDDEAPLRRIITAELRDAGYETIEAGNGREGLAAIAEHRPDLVLCDVGMPVMSGYELLAELRARYPDSADIPFVFLSALAERKDVIAGKQLGADDYVTKPVDIELLLATLQARLGQIRRIGEKFAAERGRIEEERRRVEERLQYLATHDETTGLANRSFLLALLDQECRAEAEVEGPGPHMLLVDIDRFKRIGAALGHLLADELLRTTGRRLVGAVPPEATVGRIFDDRLGVVCPKGLTVGDAFELAERMRQAISAPFDLGGRRVFATATIGVACCPDDAGTAEALLSSANLAVQAGKQSGGNICERYRPGAAGNPLETLTIEAALRSALEEAEFHLVYQPKLAFDDRRLVGMETLLRWTSATLGPVSPAVFIPVAEQSGLILPIGEHVLREACRQMRKWLDAGLADGLQVAVNISVQQLKQPELPAIVADLLEQSRLPASAVVLEITESGLVDESGELAATLSALRDLGLTLSIDDFGTGYSSLSYLGRLPAHELKIDQSFVRGLPDTEGSRNIVEAVIDIGRRLGLKLVAEGVETEQQFAFLRDRGCDVAQGYLLSRPLPPEDFAEFMRGAAG